MCSVCCAEISEDASMMAVGFSDSRIKVWSLVPQKLKAMKNAEQLQDINLEAGKISLGDGKDNTCTPLL